MSRMKSDPPASFPLGPQPVSEPLARARARLFELEPGGSEARPLEVTTSAVIEPKAESMFCPRCSGHFAILEHEARSRGRLRELTVACRHCGERRSLWFRINAPS